MPLIKRGFMDYYKINKRGQITIPKYIREKYDWTTDIPLDILEKEGAILIKPAYVCCQCKKPLPKELFERRACLDCTPPVEIAIY